MQRGRVFAGMTLALALMFPLVGCATGKVNISMQKLCQSHAGVWSASAETCGLNAAGQAQATRHAKEICAEQGGSYLPGGTCQLGF